RNDWEVIICLSLSPCFELREFERIDAYEDKKVNRVALLRDVLWSKQNLCTTVMNHYKIHWSEFTFPCFVLPKDVDLLKQYHEEIKDKEEELKQISLPQYIGKPYVGGGGAGINFYFDLNEIPLKTKQVIQPYMRDPYLIQGKKWDLRSFVLL